MNIYSKTGCKDINNYIKKNYPNIYLNCIDCKNSNLNHCFKQKTPTKKKKTPTKKKKN
jgi:hypothetical protein